MTERLTAYLNYFLNLANQPINRWDGFDAGAPDQLGRALGCQISFAGYALAGLLKRLDVEAEQRDQARAGLAALVERMLQRRVWASWADRLDQRGMRPDPIEEGALAYSGPLGMLLGLYGVLGGDDRFHEPFSLIWNSNWRFRYSHAALVENLARQMRANPCGGIAGADGEVRTALMGHALWAAVLHDRSYDSDYSEANRLWVTCLERDILIGGLRLPGRGALRPYYNLRTRRAGGASSLLDDAYGLALLAPLAPELANRAAGRISAALHGLTRSPDPTRALEAATGYLMAVELNDSELAGALLAWAERTLAPAEEQGMRYFVAAPLVARACFALGEAGGLGLLLCKATMESQGSIDQ